MLNFYHTKQVKKYLPKTENPSFENTKIALNSRILIIGSSGAGKTNALLNYIMESPNTFSHIIAYIFPHIEQIVLKSLFYYLSFTSNQ